MSSNHGVLETLDSWDNWELCSQQLEEYFASNRLPDDERVAVLLAVLNPQVYGELRESCHPDLPRLKTYDELSHLIKARHSSGAYNSSKVFKKRVEFFQATQTDEEGLVEWLSRIVSLAANCEFDDQFESMLKDHFVSGLANREMTRKLCQETATATLTHIVFLAGKLEAEISERSSASEQEGPQSKKRKIRDLDSSINAHLTSEADILPCYEDNRMVMQTRKIDLRNLVCLMPEIIINYFTGKENTLVDVNLHGIPFKDFQQLGHFLQPMIHIKRLSVDLPDMKTEDIPLVSEMLQEPLKRLNYLSVKIIILPWSREFTSLLKLCEGLKEVLITKSWSKYFIPEYIWNPERKELKNLEIVNYRGPYAERFKEHFVTFLPRDPEKWMELPITMNSNSALDGFCLEKDVKVCEELLGKNVIRGNPRLGIGPEGRIGSLLFPELLIKEVLKITHENVPVEFCCLSMLRKAHANVLKTEETKRLLENRNRLAISYLCINHRIEPNCDVHLLASAFPKLTELILSTGTKDDEITEPTTRNRHPRRRDSASPEEEDDPKNMNRNSSFQMLIKNTPHLKHLTLGIPGKSNGEWDLATVNLISGRKSLKTLHLMFTLHGCCTSEDKVAEESFCKNLILSTKKLIHQCSQLTALLVEIALKFEANYDMLSSGLKRLKARSSRSNLQIRVVLLRLWQLDSSTTCRGYAVNTYRPIRDESDVDTFFSSTGKTPLLAVNRE